MRARTIFFSVMMALSLACTKGAGEAKGEVKGEVKGEAKGAPAAGKAGADAAPAAALPEAATVLEQAVVAVGGKDKVDAITSFYVEGQLAVSGQNITGEMKLWWKGGNFYTEQTMIGIGTIRGGKQGETIWSQDPINGLRKLSGTEAEQYSWGSSLLLAADWQRYFTTAETVGERELEGKKVYDIKLTSKSGAQVTLTFDAASGLQVAQEFKGSTPLGEMPIAVELQDYREVGGLKLPYKQVTDAKLAEATQTISKIELNGPIDESKFAMPSGGAEVIKPPVEPPAVGP
jgi:hypothetical protein